MTKMYGLLKPTGELVATFSDYRIADTLAVFNWDAFKQRFRDEVAPQVPTTSQVDVLYKSPPDPHLFSRDDSRCSALDCARHSLMSHVEKDYDQRDIESEKSGQHVSEGDPVVIELKALRAIAALLYTSLSQHRVDWHNTSNRPCPTCRQSLAIMEVYETMTGTIPIADHACEPHRRKVVSS